MDPLYFLDEMSQDELGAIYKAKYDSDKASWEQTRLICFWNVVSTNGTKTFKKPADLFKFTWEKQSNKPESKRLTKEEIMAKVNKNRIRKKQ